MLMITTGSTPADFKTEVSGIDPARLDQQADCELQHGHHKAAERLSHAAAALREAGGKIRYAQIVSFTGKAARDRFSCGVIDVLRQQRPEVLS